MSQTKETEYKQLVDNFVEQFKGDYKDVIDDEKMTIAGFKDRLLDIAKNKMPDLERDILLKQEPALKIITSLTTTDNNRQKAISDYQQILNSPKDEVDKALEALEQKDNPSEIERRKHADAMFEMHMIMALQEKVDLIAKNMSDPDAARAMANTQHDSRKLVRDLRRNSMNLAKGATEAKDPAAIEAFADQLTTLERRVEGMAIRKSQNLALAVENTDAQINSKPNPTEEEKLDSAFVHNNKNYFELTMEGIRESLDTARKMIIEAMQKATQSVNRPPENSATKTSADTSPKVKDKQKRGSIIERIREMSTKRASERKSKRDSKRDSKRESEATNPFNVIQGNEGRASFKAGEDWKVVDKNDTKTASSSSLDNNTVDNSSAADISPVSENDTRYYVPPPTYEDIDFDNDDELIDEKDEEDPEIAKKLSETEQATRVENKRGILHKREAPKSRPASTSLDTTPTQTTHSAAKPASTQNTVSFPTGRNPKPSAELLEALARVKAEEQAKKHPSMESSTKTIK